MPLDTVPVDTLPLDTLPADTLLVDTETLEPQLLIEIINTDVRTKISDENTKKVLKAGLLVSMPPIPNLRDAGAVPGSCIPLGRVYRCGTLHEVKDGSKAFEWLANSVQCIVDIRIDHDGPLDPTIKNVKSIRKVPRDGQYHPFLLDDFATEERAAAAWSVQYMDIVLAYIPTFRAALEYILENPRKPILIHCYAGRDRTGILAGLLQHLAGSPAEVAASDYMLSRVGNELMRDEMIKFALEELGITEPETPGFYNVVQQRKKYWEEFLKTLGERFGGWDGYVTSADGLDFSENDLEKLKANMRAP